LIVALIAHTIHAVPIDNERDIQSAQYQWSPMMMMGGFNSVLGGMNSMLLRNQFPIDYSKYYSEPSLLLLFFLFFKKSENLIYEKKGQGCSDSCGCMQKCVAVFWVSFFLLSE
jgi:hypothetical protein